MSAQEVLLIVAVASGIASVVGAVATIGGGLALIYRAGSFVGAMQAAAKGISEMKTLLERIPAIETRQELQEARMDRIEHRTDSAHARALIAEERASQHDGE